MDEEDVSHESLENDFSEDEDEDSYFKDQTPKNNGGDRNVNHENQFFSSHSSSDSIVVFTHTHATVVCYLCNSKTISVLKKFLVGMGDYSFGLCKQKLTQTKPIIPTQLGLIIL